MQKAYFRHNKRAKISVPKAVPTQDIQYKCNNHILQPKPFHLAAWRTSFENEQGEVIFQFGESNLKFVPP